LSVTRNDHEWIVDFVIDRSHYLSYGRQPPRFYQFVLGGFEIGCHIEKGRRQIAYFNGTPMFAFGHGLSYTKFDFSSGKLDAKKIPATGTAKEMPSVAWESPIRTWVTRAARSNSSNRLLSLPERSATGSGSV